MNDSAVVSWIGGPVLRARTEAAFQINESVWIGPRRLLGEVMQIRGGEIVVQVYEDATGLKPGDPVERTFGPVSVRLGPGLLGHLFDGLLRPLSVPSHFISPGARPAPAISYPVTASVRVGDVVGPGQVFAEAELPNGQVFSCRVPPRIRGTVTRVAAPGVLADDAPVCIVQTPDDTEKSLSVTERWGVRDPRPVAKRLAPAVPMLTGQRILDTLAPLARGGRAALPGGFGTGKTILQQALAKFSDADVVVYVGCGERGNEMAEVLEEFPALQDPRTNRPLMERTVVIANTSDMPVAAREASIYTGVTVAEYFRDQGLHVALMADSTSRWAEALREISGRLGELPAEGGYPAYLSSRLASFYERAGHVQTLGGDEGSLTIIGAVSPAGGDFSEPVTKHTERYVRCLWSLDPGRARARLYPAVDPLASYSEDVAALAPWWESRVNPRWTRQRLELLELLEEQAKLERMARIIGRDALPTKQQLVLLTAELATDGFLRQSALSDVDSHCSPERQSAALRLISRFARLATEALERGVALETIAQLPVLRSLQRMNEELGDDQLDAFDALGSELEADFAALDRSDADAS